MQTPIEPPAEIRLLTASRVLQLRWADGTVQRLNFAGLRAACACASCVAAGQNGDPVVADDVAVTGIKPAWIAGLQLVFSDGHDRGIFPWRYLRSLGGERPSGAAVAAPSEEHTP